jgi:hypothetical protein
MFRLLPRRVIARITGWCLGGTLTVIAGCDIAIYRFGRSAFGLPTAVLTQHLRPPSWLQKPVQNLQHTLLNCGPMKAVGPSSG